MASTKHNWCSLILPLTLALFVLSASQTFAATVTGTLKDAGLENRTRAKLIFHPLSTPYAYGASTITSVDRVTYATNGVFGIVLAQGRYAVNIDSVDQMEITVPTDSGTVTLNTCATLPAVTVNSTNQLPPSLFLRAGANVTFVTNNPGMLSESVTIASTGGGTSGMDTNAVNAVVAAAVAPKANTADVVALAFVMATKASIDDLADLSARSITNGHSQPVTVSNTVSATGFQGLGGAGYVSIPDASSNATITLSGSNGVVRATQFAGGGNSISNVPLTGVAGLVPAIGGLTDRVVVLENSPGGGTATNLTVTTGFTNQVDLITFPIGTNTSVSLTIEVLLNGATNRYAETVTWLVQRGTGAPYIVSTNGLLPGSVVDTNAIIAASTNAAKAYTDARVTDATNVISTVTVTLNCTAAEQFYVLGTRVPTVIIKTNANFAAYISTAALTTNMISGNLSWVEARPIGTTDWILRW